MRTLSEIYHLSTEGYYFQYKLDKNNAALIRATLYKTGTNDIADDVSVSAGYGMPEKSHHDVINYFEARLALKAMGIF